MLCGVKSGLIVVWWILWGVFLIEFVIFGVVDVVCYLVVVKIIIVYEEDEE